MKTERVEPGRIYTFEIEGRQLEGKVLRASQELPSGWLIETCSGCRLIVDEGSLIEPLPTAISSNDRVA